MGKTTAHGRLLRVLVLQFVAALSEASVRNTVLSDTRSTAAEQNVGFPDGIRTTGLLHSRQQLQVDADKALWDAASDGDLIEVKEWLIKGANPNVTLGAFGDSPLTIAAANGHGTIVKDLLKAGADVDSMDTHFGATALFWASLGNHENVVKILIKWGANTEKSDKALVTPLEIAAEKGHASVVTALLAGGADPNRVDLIGDSALHVASVTLGQPSEVIVVQLVERGADIDGRSTDGSTPLMWAATFGNLRTTRALLSFGADPDLTDHLNRTAIDLICACKESEGLDHLLQCPLGGCDMKGKGRKIKKALESY